MITFDTTAVIARVEAMQETLRKLSNEQWPNELDAWQHDSFKRKKPNLEVTRPFADSVRATTKFWGRVTYYRTGKRAYILKRAQAGQRGVRGFILRPSKVLEIAARMKQLAHDTVKW
jgi:hypothetical protein